MSVLIESHHSDLKLIYKSLLLLLFLFNPLFLIGPHSSFVIIAKDVTYWEDINSFFIEDIETARDFPKKIFLYRDSLSSILGDTLYLKKLNKKYYGFTTKKEYFQLYGVSYKNNYHNMSRIDSSLYYVISHLETESFHSKTMFFSNWLNSLLVFCGLLILTTIVFIIFLFKSRKKLGIELVRNQIASNLHDDIGSNLSAIKNLLDLISIQNSRNRSSLSSLTSKVHEYINETIVSLQDVVWSINPKYDSVDQLFEKMKNFANLMAISKGIRLIFEDDYQKLPNQQVDLSQRYIILLIFKEAINNIIKHANARTIKVHIFNSGQEITILINDDGEGFNVNKKYNGYGLQNFISRSKENFIDLELTSNLEIGTTLKIHILTLN